MTAPTLVATYAVASWDVTTGTQTVTVTTSAGDYLVVIAVSEDSGTTMNTPSGNGVTFTQAQASAVPFSTAAAGWTGVDATGGSNWTLTVTRATGSGTKFGFIVWRFSSASGFDASNKGVDTAGSAPSVSLTTTAANSAVVWGSGDWSATDGTTRTWRTVNGNTPTAGNGQETLYHLSTGYYAIYGAAWPDAGAAGANTYGLTAPSQVWTGILIGVKGIVSAAAAPQPRPQVLPPIAVVRAAVW